VGACRDAHEAQKQAETRKPAKATEGDIGSEQEEDSFNLIDWSGDLLGSLTGVSVAVLHNDVTGLLTGAAVGPGVAHAFRYGAKLFVSNGLMLEKSGVVGRSTIRLRRMKDRARLLLWDYV
jgi:hypothetical protein